MTEEILANLYRIQIPLPQSPLKAVNSYVIKDPERNLIIDTGWNQEICMNAMQTGLKELGVDLNKTDFFITHLHADHLGLVLSLVTKTSKIYFNQPDADRLKGGFLWDDFVSFARLNGYPDNEIEEVSRSHPGLKFRTKETPVFHTLKEGDLIRIGNYAFRCIATPGHSFGHLCLYEPDKKILVAGDHVLNDITPNKGIFGELREGLST
jgi:glyoxylase-like metal-dependent hydrolase (beta-lactamase superfamily II)